MPKCTLNIKELSCNTEQYLAWTDQKRAHAELSEVVQMSVKGQNYITRSELDKFYKVSNELKMTMLCIVIGTIDFNTHVHIKK
jgi:hypothetical protein